MGGRERREGERGREGRIFKYGANWVLIGLTYPVPVPHPRQD